eukprot:6491034-Amphidinium_carterae.3
MVLDCVGGEVTDDFMNYSSFKDNFEMAMAEFSRELAAGAGRTLLFGVTSGPLLWCRVAAFVMRATQAFGRQLWAASAQGPAAGLSLQQLWGEGVTIQVDGSPVGGGPTGGAMVWRGRWLPNALYMVRPNHLFRGLLDQQRAVGAESMGAFPWAGPILVVGDGLGIFGGICANECEVTWYQFDG